MPTETLNKIVPVLLLLLAGYFILKPDLPEGRPPLLPMTFVSFAFAPLVGFYDGIFGPGAGSIYMAVFMGIGGLTTIVATAQTKLANFASNVGGFILFGAIGAVTWKLGLLMAIGQVIGARIGAKLAIKNGERIIRPLLVTMSVLMALRLLLT